MYVLHVYQGYGAISPADFPVLVVRGLCACFFRVESTAPCGSLYTHRGGLSHRGAKKNQETNDHLNTIAQGFAMTRGFAAAPCGKGTPKAHVELVSITPQRPVYVIIPSVKCLGVHTYEQHQLKIFRAPLSLFFRPVLCSSVAPDQQGAHRRDRGHHTPHK